MMMNGEKGCGLFRKTNEIEEEDRGGDAVWGT